VKIRYFNENDDTFPAAVQQAVDRVSEQYRQQNPNTLLSLYLGKYTIEFTVDHEPVEGAVPMITLDEGLLRTELSTMPGNQQNSGTQRTFTYDVNVHTLEGALAVNLAANLNKFLQRPINKFRHQASDEQQPGLQIVMRVDRNPRKAERMGITFSRT
jgi:hypothetical protein